MTRPKVVNNNFKKRTIRDCSFPSDKEIEEITEKVSAPDYLYKNYVLPKNANSIERAKYELCQDIVKYYQKNNLSEKELAKMLKVNKDKLIDILFSKIYNLNLEEIINYTNNLHIPFEITIASDSSTKREIKITNQNEVRQQNLYK